MWVYNATHIHWTQVCTGGSQDPAQYDVVCDDVWYVQHTHGSFNKAETRSAA